MGADGSDGSGRTIFVLGLTGSIGMGKSTVGKFFTALGVPLLDADQVVHDMYAPGGRAVAPIGSAFPSAVVDGAVSRPALSAAVLGDNGAMKRLEAIVHPLVSDDRARFLRESAAQGHSLVVLDIPLLYETHLEGEVDAIAVVSAPASVQRERVLARPGMTEQRFDAILARQVPDEEKRRRADFVVDTSVSREETEAHVATLVKALRGRRGRAVAA